jgi:hypothetical protein
VGEGVRAGGTEVGVEVGMGPSRMRLTTLQARHARAKAATVRGNLQEVVECIGSSKANSEDFIIGTG